MFQITPILADNLHPVIANVVPIIAQNLASKNSEIQDLASNILDIFIEFIGNYLYILSFIYLRLKDLIGYRWQSINSTIY